MRELTIDELKRHQIEILDDICQFCEENNIKCWIDYGTLLGAIRHGGYIPWDDDIDMGMLREDYDRFVKLYNQRCEREGSHFSAHSVEIDKTYRFPYVKVHDDRTVLYAPDIHGFQFAVNVDIFPYDDAPEDIKQFQKKCDRQELLCMLSALRNAKDHVPSGSAVRRLAVNALTCVIKLLPENFFSRLMPKNAKHNGKPSDYIDCFVAESMGKSAEKSIFDEIIQVEFEGKKYPAPARYDEWLTDLYGDYMQLPPVEERVTKHDFVAYLKE